MICLFLAVLEMVKLHAVELVQKDLFDEIALKRAKISIPPSAASGPIHRRRISSRSRICLKMKTI